MRKLLIGSAAAVAVLAVAALAAPLLIPAEFVKRQIAGVVLGKTGRELRITGPIDFSLLPRIAITADDVSLANAPGGVAAHLLEIRRVEVSVRLLPLFQGRIEANEVNLTQPSLNLEIDRDGRRNWDFRRPAGPPAAAPTATASHQVSIAVERIAVSGGAVSSLDRRGAKQQSASNIELTASLPDDGAVSVEGVTTWNGENLRFAVAAASLVGLEHNGSDGTIRIASAPVNLDFKGSVALGPRARAAGTLSLKSPSLRRLLAWAGISEGRSRSGTGTLSIDANIAAGAGKIALTDATFALDDAVGKGSLSLDRDRTRPLLSGKLDIDRLNLDPYSETREASPDAAQSPPAAASTPPAAPAETRQPPPPPAPPDTTPIAWPRFEKFDAELNIIANSLHFRRFDAGNSSLFLHLKDGKLDMDVADMALYGGNASGNIAVAENAGAPSIAAKLNFAKVDVGPLLLAIWQADPITGKGDLAFDLQASGRTSGELVTSLSGSGRVDLANGVLTGFLVDPFNPAVAKTETGSKVQGGQLPYNSLSASYTIAHGVLKNEDLRMAAPQLTATGAGTVELSSCRANYRWNPIVPGKGSAQIAITGPCDALVYRAMTLTITKGLTPPSPKKR